LLHADAVSSIIFEEPSDYLGDPDFNEAWFYNLKQGTLSVPIFAQLPWVARSVLSPFTLPHPDFLTASRLFTTPMLKYVLEKATGWRVWDDVSAFIPVSGVETDNKIESSTPNSEDKITPKR
jgi:hypothetical protein